MPKTPTFPTIIDSVRTVPISFLEKEGYLDRIGTKKGMLYWTAGVQTTGSVQLMVRRFEASAVMTLQYRLNGEPISYQVDIVSRVSPFGGLIWLFTCPRTGKKCRMLYESGKYFLHRDTLGHAMYASQVVSKHYREISKEYAILRFQDERESFSKKYAKRRYRGKLTRRYSAFLRKVGLLDEIVSARAGPAEKNQF